MKQEPKRLLRTSRTVIMKLVSFLILGLCGNLSESHLMERIQGLPCREKPYSFFDPCRETPASLQSSIFREANISTVMKCEQKQRCSLHLRVHSAMQISDGVRGMSFCVTSVGMLQSCTELIFPRSDRKKLAGQQVQIQSGCYRVLPGQQVEVTLKTVPNYCELTWSRRYHVQDCNDVDLRNNVPECITGKIAYTVDTDRKELSVMVTGMLENEDYNLRLCHQGFACRGAGPHVLLKKENPIKNATFRYSRPLPCLCIEGWSRVTDAPRVQVCPFRNRTEELWSGVTFDPEGEILSWESLCAVEAVVTLCHTLDGHPCVDLINSTQVVNRNKVAYTRVDPNPQLCMKFTTREGSWIKCPFADGKITAWNLEVTAGWHQAILTSRMRAELSLSLCGTDPLFPCSMLASVAVGEPERAVVNLTLDTDICNGSVCIQVRRVDTHFSVPVIRCHIQCVGAGSVRMRANHWKVEQTLVLALLCFSAAVLAGLAANVMLTVFQRCRMGEASGSDPAFPKGPELFSKVKPLPNSEDGADPNIPHPVGVLEKLLASLSLSRKMADTDGQVKESRDIAILHLPVGCERELDRLLKATGGQSHPQQNGMTLVLINCDLRAGDPPPFHL
ncbi:uncharacterized protein LOC125751312 isoform X2 [Brienomyrus brachyistius]|uniref:uncharacterized protein LOC125751312 isoform X2 n=1 Tax=Brienomyrus brachyistius TaxID=42636 RepID=UPI0020B1A73F|nr:uncharacterized protein LOC125751312 isoform X2 [Brienomyrus brachyistius]